MDLYHDAVSAGSSCRGSHGGHEAGFSGGVAGIYHHRQVGHLVQDGYGGNIQGIAGAGLEGTNAPLAEDNVFVALAHNIFRAHQKLLQCVGKTPLEQDRLFGLAQLLQKVKILHISGAHLNNVYIVEKLQSADVHDFCNNGKTCDLFGFQKQVNALSLHTLKRIGRGAGLESTAPKDLCASLLDGCGNLNDLLFRFYAARACNHGKMTAANAHITDLNHRVLGVEFAVGLLIGLRHPLDRLHDLQTAQQLHIYPGGIANEAKDGYFLTFGNMHIQVHVLQPVN